MTKKLLDLESVLPPLYLNSEDLEKLKLKEIGRGTDAILYKSPKELGKQYRGTILKLYHENNLKDLTNDVEYKAIYDEEGVNIADNREYFRKKRGDIPYKTSYYNGDVKIYGIDAVFKAIQRQKNVKLTKLQKQPIYVDGRFRGTVLHHHNHHWAIANLGMYPMKTKIRVLKELLDEEEELLHNNIYHVDLSFKEAFANKEANVLLSIGLNPHPTIIDIDGKSAVYTDTFNENLYRTSLLSYKSLLVSLIFEFYNEDNYEEGDYLYFVAEMQSLLDKYGIKLDKDYLMLLVDAEAFMDIDEMRNLLNYMEDCLNKKNNKKINH